MLALIPFLLVVDSAKNLGVIFQTGISIDKNISSDVLLFQLHPFHCIRLFITKTAVITLSNASFAHSSLYFCNSLVYGLPKCSIHCL